MGYRELIESLRKEGEEKINLLWSEAHDEAEKINAETSRRIEEIRERYKVSRENAVKVQEEAILSDVKTKERTIRLTAEKALSDRLFSVALTLLHELRNKKYVEVFTSLAGELADIKWQEIRVNPEDLSIAQEHFPYSNIIPDDTIAGGMEALKEGGKIHVINTFRKRLERAWEDILPLMISDVYKEISEYKNPA